MNKQKIREALEECRRYFNGAKQHITAGRLVSEALASLDAEQDGVEPVGVAGAMPGTSGFTMAAFKAGDVPIGTALYARPPASPVSVEMSEDLIANPDELISIRWRDYRTLLAAAKPTQTSPDLHMHELNIEGAKQYMQNSQDSFVEAIRMGEKFETKGALSGPIATQDKDQDVRRECGSSEIMFRAAIRDLAAISEALGLDPDDGGADPILDAIEELQTKVAATEQAQAREPVQAHQWVSTGFDPHKSECCYKCSVCGETDWTAPYGSPNELKKTTCVPRVATPPASAPSSNQDAQEEQSVSSIDYQQRRGALADIIDEAISAYEQFMLDDDYNSQAALDRIMTRIRERRDLYAARKEQP